MCPSIKPAEVDTRRPYPPMPRPPNPPHTHPDASRRAASGTFAAGTGIVSGEIGGDAPSTFVPPPLVAPGTPVLLHVRENCSEVAQVRRRPFEFIVTTAGALVHAESPGTGNVRTMLHCARREDPGLLSPLVELFDRAGLEDTAPTIGAGEHFLEITWHGGSSPLVRALRCTVRGDMRHFGGAPVSAGLVDLFDGLWHLIGLIDRGGAAAKWPDRESTRMFPCATDLLARTRAVRLTVTTGGWREVWASEVDGLFGRSGRPGAWTTQARPMPFIAVAFDELEGLGPARFRQKIGFVRTRNYLEDTHLEVLSWFDGTRVHTTEFVYGSVHHHNIGGTAHGDAPPNRDEAAAFELLNGWMRSVI